MMEYIIRLAIEEDYQEACRLFAEEDAVHRKAVPQVFRKPPGPFRTKEFFSDQLGDGNSAIFVAEHEGRIVGLVTIHIRDSSDIPIMVPRKYAYIGDIVVTKTYRRQGIGDALMNEAQRWAIQRNVFDLELNVWDFNIGAINLFRNLGYSMSRHQMWKSIEH